MQGVCGKNRNCYLNLKRALALTVLDAHHISRGRFAPLLGCAGLKDMMAMAVDSLQHNALDLARGDGIPSGQTAVATRAKT
jgi:hypothetical protein